MPHSLQRHQKDLILFLVQLLQRVEVRAAYKPLLDRQEVLAVAALQVAPATIQQGVLATLQARLQHKDQMEVTGEILYPSKRAAVVVAQAKQEMLMGKDLVGMVLHHQFLAAALLTLAVAVEPLTLPVQFQMPD